MSVEHTIIPAQPGWVVPEAWKDDEDGWVGCCNPVIAWAFHKENEDLEPVPITLVGAEREHALRAHQETERCSRTERNADHTCEHVAEAAVRSMTKEERDALVAEYRRSRAS